MARSQCARYRTGVHSKLRGLNFVVVVLMCFIDIIDAVISPEYEKTF